MPALLALIPGKDWIYSAIIVLVAAAGVYEVHHERQLGAKHELAALAVSTAKLNAQTAAQTATLKAKATMAEQAYDKERLTALNTPLPMPVVRLCNNPAGSGSVVPSRASKVARDALKSTSAGIIQPVSAGDPSSAGPDIGGMLSALAASADQVSSTLREYQSRE